MWRGPAACQGLPGRTWFPAWPQSGPRRYRSGRYRRGWAPLPGLFEIARSGELEIAVPARRPLRELSGGSGRSEPGQASPAAA